MSLTHEIAEADVGKKFLARNGDEHTIKQVFAPIDEDGDALLWRVTTVDKDGDMCLYRINGRFRGQSFVDVTEIDDECDLVSRVEEKSEALPLAFTIEPGTQYRTRHDEMAVVVDKHPVSDDPKYVVCAKNGPAYLVDGTGKNLGGNSSYDLVALWSEPKRIKGFVNIYPGDNFGDYACTSVFCDRSQADACASLTRVACVEIDVLEGHGLNGEAR